MNFCGRIGEKETQSDRSRQALSHVIPTKLWFFSFFSSTKLWLLQYLYKKTSSIQRITSLCKTGCSVRDFALAAFKPLRTAQARCGCGRLFRWRRRSEVERKRDIQKVEAYMLKWGLGRPQWPSSGERSRQRAWVLCIYVLSFSRALALLNSAIYISPTLALLLLLLVIRFWLQSGPSDGLLDLARPC